MLILPFTLSLPEHQRSVSNILGISGLPPSTEGLLTGWKCHLGSAIYFRLWWMLTVNLSTTIPGKKQDIWYVIDLLTGEKQQTLSSAFADSLCPSTSLLYLGRTGKK